MLVFKKLLLGLLILISLSLVFTQPGINSFKIFNNDLARYNESTTIIEKAGNFIFAKYPPGLYLTLSSILKIFPPNPGNLLFYKEPAWVASKVILYVFYLLTWFSLLKLYKGLNSKNKLSFFDVSIAYFGSVSLMLSTLNLSFWDILAAPFFLASIYFLLKKRVISSGFFYLIALSFNWSLLILAPLFYLYCSKNNQPKFFYQIPFITIPLLITIVLGTRLIFLNQTAYSIFTNTKLFGYSLNISHAPRLEAVMLIALMTIAIFCIGFLIKNIFFSSSETGKKINLFMPYLISIFGGIISSLLFNSFFPLFLLVLSIVLIATYRKLSKSKSISIFDFLTASLSIYFSYLIFWSEASDGNLLWPVLISIVLFIANKSSITYLHLLAINLLVFIKLFIFWGAAGEPPVRGIYFESFKYIFSSVFILIFTYYISSWIRNLSINNISLKWFIVIILVLLNLSLIPSTGTSDHVAWSDYANTTITYSNPFRAHVVKEVDQLYPPVSTVILSAFANLWKIIIGPSKDYSIAIKISIFVFYVLTIWKLIKFKISKKDQTLSLVNKLLIILTTFSLMIQTQGFADLNIYVIPTLIAATAFLFKKNYFLSGLFFGLTISIKWQPIILLPLFCATIFNLKKLFPISAKNLFSFFIGFLLIPITVWMLVFIQPGGSYTMGRSFNFILHGAAALSGQALNLNWIATYLLHIIEPVKYTSLTELGGLNRQIETLFAPFFLQGYLFILATGIILTRYWLFIKKGVHNFLNAALMIFFSHQILNKSAYEKHLFYTVFFMLFIYLLRPTQGNRKLLILFDIMTVMNLIFFYGFTGTKDINRLFFGFDITIAFSIYYIVIFLWVFIKYIRSNKLPL